LITRRSCEGSERTAKRRDAGGARARHPARGVVSPLLANLFLHYALDAWLRREMRSVRFCRYADDAVIHCKSEVQARLVLRKLGERLRACGLELHPEKMRIVYCHDVNRQGTSPTIQFTFLDYTFRPRKAVDKYGRVYVNFAPGVNREALRTMRQTVRGLRPLNGHVGLASKEVLSKTGDQASRGSAKECRLLEKRFHSG
jgi:hypothetical protein